MIQDKIVALLQPSIEDMGYVLWGCEYLAGRQALLRIYIDKEDGIGITDCERVSQRISAVLDVEDPIPGYYRLEVSSPGIPRPLFFPWQYEQYLNHNVHLKLYAPVDGQRKFLGTVVAMDHQGVTLNIDEKQQYFLFSNIAKANVMTQI